MPLPPVIRCHSRHQGAVWYFRTDYVPPGQTSDRFGRLVEGPYAWLIALTRHDGAEDDAAIAATYGAVTPAVEGERFETDDGQVLVLTEIAGRNPVLAPA